MKRTLFLALAAAVGVAAAPAGAAPAIGSTVSVQGGEIQFSVDGLPAALTEADLRYWLTNAADGVAAVFGGFPVERAAVAVRTLESGGGIGDGKTTPGDPPRIRLSLGRDTARRTLRDDWVLVHEMVHLGFPAVAGPHEWMSEGLATYVEPIARVRNGTLSEEEFWADLVRDLPQGLPHGWEKGFNNSPSWASTYWGGALFWFLADVELRKASGGKRGVPHALRGLRRSGANFNKRMTAPQVVAALDRAAGGAVFSRLYREWALKAGSVDLDRLWTDLGVRSLSARFGAVGFEAAPLAAVRKGILAADDR